MKLRDEAADDRMAGTPSLLAYLPQILAYPLHGFCPPVTLMIALFTWIGVKSFMGLPMLAITAIWALHYLLNIIDHTSHGHATPPPLGGEAAFLGIGTVFQALLLPLAALTAAWGLHFGPAARAVLGLAAFLWPAALFALATSRDWNAAANPLRWLHVIAGMGLAYLLPCALLALGVGLLGMVPAGAGLALLTALVCYVLFATAHLLGFVGYHRREQLDLDTRVGDPAEKRAREDQEQRIEGLLARIEQSLNAGEVGTAARAIAAESGDRGFFEELFERLLRRRHPVLLHTAGRRLVTTLVAERRLARAVEVYEACEHQHPGFEPESPEQLPLLAGQALEQRLAGLFEKIAGDIERRYPGDPVAVPLGLLQARYWSEQRQDDARALAVLAPLRAQRQHPQHAQVESLVRALQRLNAAGGQGASP
ncbi:MAG TPA: hypothetical protein VM074_05925 [Solimonas sp.]|nr:hypothetical protein [Solimonas sp.]